jgi:hypothetical protein
VRVLRTTSHKEIRDEESGPKNSRTSRPRRARANGATAQTASGSISESPLVLTDISADDGTVGHSMIFTYAVAALKPTADLIKNLESFVKDEPLAPTEIADNFRNVFGSSVSKGSLPWRFLPSTWRFGTL